uniref:Very-long-chain (3R)-3-hydroxyacyl-CoA dehydratase n=1 Tax=Stegastes partitus TaxID=144197 RepID=A0A3B5APB0_9TELE
TEEHLIPTWLTLSFRLAYIFSYNLFQFCGHTWILANTIARFLTFGQDALADTFYSVGFVMSLCQLLSILELFHIADGIEKARLLPRLFQVRITNLLLIMVIKLEDIQSKPVVCVQFFLWNIQDLLRYANRQLLSTPLKTPKPLLYVSALLQHLIISLCSSGVTIYEALHYIEQTASNPSTVSPYVHFPLVLMLYLPVLALGKMN